MLVTAPNWLLPVNWRSALLLLRRKKWQGSSYVNRKSRSFRHVSFNKNTNAKTAPVSTISRKCEPVMILARPWPPAPKSSKFSQIRGLKGVELRKENELEKQVDSSVIAPLLRQCSKANGLCEGKKIHAQVIGSDKVRDVYLGNFLVNMYGKSGDLNNCHNVFDRIEQRNVFSWSILIASFVQHGFGNKVLHLFAQMQVEEVNPNRYTFSSILSACCGLGSLAKGKVIHASVVSRNFGGDTVVGNALVNFYAKYGSVDDARITFERIRTQDVISWNAMIGAYGQNGLACEALDLYMKMQLQGVELDMVAFSTVVNACGNVGVLEEGKRLHACIIRRGFGSDVFLGTSLMNMYGDCQALDDAIEVLGRMPKRDVVAWTTMVAAFVQNGHEKEALEVFRQMQNECVEANEVTFISLVNGCATLGSLGNGKLLHANVIDHGFDLDVCLGTSVLNMYGKCGNIVEARRVFCKFSDGSLPLWNAMIATAAQNGHNQEAIALFHELQKAGHNPNKITFVSILEGCGSLLEGKDMHLCIRDSGFESDVVVRNALITMYCKWGSLEDAHNVFVNMHERDVISWNGMITACAQHGHSKEAIELFQEMSLNGIDPNNITVVSVLDACANMADAKAGMHIHKQIATKSFELDVFVETALLNMYNKCGNVEYARTIFDNMRERNLFSWTTMISAYAQHGHGKEVFDLLQKMQQQGLMLTKVGLISMLSACSYTGLLDEALHLFIVITQSSEVPSIEHYGCLIDLLSRLGLLSESEDVLHNLPFEANAVLWTIMFGACKMHGDVQRGNFAAIHSIDLDPRDSGIYTLLSNMYADFEGNRDYAATCVSQV